MGARTRSTRRNEGDDMSQTGKPRVWMDARWPNWDTADSFVDGDEPATEHTWVPLYDETAVQELRQECRRMRETLNFIAEHFSSNWPERCQSNVLAARHALTKGTT